MARALLGCALALTLAPVLAAAQDKPADAMTQSATEAEVEEPDFAASTLNVRTGDGYRLVQRYDVPPGHAIHDGLIAFEGPGWESDRVAYRLYLDERNVPDIFGKQLPGRILPRIGMGVDDYHALADWGMDVFKVGDTLGMGGVGVLRNGRVTQLGRARIGVETVDQADGSGAQVTVTSRGFAGAGGPADLVTTYAITRGSRTTAVRAQTSGSVPAMIAGITVHPDVERIEGEGDGWRWIATWGRQSLNNDGLGIALFYRAGEVRRAEVRDGTWFVEFCDPGTFEYAFAAAWEREPGAPRTAAEFRAWLPQEASLLAGADELNRALGDAAPTRVRPRPCPAAAR